MLLSIGEATFVVVNARLSFAFIHVHVSPVCRRCVHFAPKVREQSHEVDLSAVQADLKVG